MGAVQALVPPAPDRVAHARPVLVPALQLGAHYLLRMPADASPAPALPFGPLHFLVQEGLGERVDVTRAVFGIYDEALRRFRELREAGTPVEPADLADLLVDATRGWFDAHHPGRRAVFDAVWARYSGPVNAAANAALLLRGMRAEDLLVAEMGAER